MSLILVNEKVIEGKRYQAFRDSVNPKLQYVFCEEKHVQVQLKEVWNNPETLKGLF